MTDLGYSDEYDIPSHVTISAGVGVGYIYLTDHSRLHRSKKTIIVESKNLRNSINLDFDAQGRLIGIELMDHKMAPPKKTCGCRDLLNPHCCTLGNEKEIHPDCPMETIVWCDEHNCLIGCSCKCHQYPAES